MSGVHIHNAPDNFIGDVDRDSGNLISCNSEGIRISGAYATGNKIQSNIIGSKKDGKTMLEVGPVRSGEGSYYIKTGNFMGVLIEASHNLLGTEKGRNVISGNTRGWHFYTTRNIEDRIHHFPSGNKIQNNFIGVDVDGKRGLPNGAEGIAIFSASNNLIGGSEPGTGNVISGHRGAGIAIRHRDSKLNRIEGNRIGTDDEGVLSVPNEIGILISDSNENFIGRPEGGNYISGNHKQGVLLVENAERNVIQGNFIGVDLPGTSKLPNEIGIEVHSSANTIGGADDKAGNVISGNRGAGIILRNIPYSGNSRGNLVQGNFIGTDEKGVENLGNEGHGLHIEHSRDNFIGATSERDPKKLVREKNTIAYNGGAGIYIELGYNNKINRNSFFGNGDKGIKLSPGLKKDSSQSPILSSIRINRLNGIRVNGRFDQPPLIYTSETVFVEFFSSEQCDPAKPGGARFIGAVDVPERKSDNFSFEPIVPVPKGHFITATATEPRRNTSEFSNCIEVR